MVLENPGRFLDQRIDVASDELSGKRAAEIVSAASGRPIDYAQVPLVKAYEISGNAAKMFEWFDTDGYSADIEALRRDHPEAGWHTFEEWAQAQDWVMLKGDGSTSNAA